MLIAALAFAPSDAAAQSLTLEYQQVLTRPMPGASAAFSLDPARVGASAQNGQVTLVGRGPGVTNVIVVIGDRTESLQVTVGEPPTVVPPGMFNNSAGNSEAGHYEIRYGSDPAVLYGNLRLVRREGDRSTELMVGGAAPFADADASPFSIPLASYTMRAGDREITLMDRVVDTSPLTVAGSNVRGLHLRQGPWQAHAGYSFFGNFEHLLLPTSKESVAGIGYRYALTPQSSLTPHVYYFDIAEQSGRSGPLASLLYETRPATGLALSAEVGIGRAVGAALAFEAERPGRRAWARLRFTPSAFPSLSTNYQSGRQVEGGWTAHGASLDVNAGISSRSYTRGAFSHSSTVGNVDVQRRLTSTWAIHGGTGYSLFDNAAQPGLTLHSLTLPVGLTFSRRHVGAGLDYQFSRETTRNLAGHLVRGNLNASAGGFRLALHGERQTHAPTATQILTEVAWLQPTLDRLGLAAGTPQQLADLMRTNAELAAYGYANSLTIDVTPVRTRGGASAGWTGSGLFAPQILASTMLNRDEMIDRTASGAIHSLSYSQRLGAATELFLTWSTLCDGGPVSASCRPATFLSLRRSLSGAGVLARRHGTIQGTVFRDDHVSGTYRPDLPTVAGVEVILDGVRRTRTDASGWFKFDDVVYGRHRVEARFESEQPTFFTTPSPAYADMGEFVHFGVGLARSSVRGIVRTDAGSGLPAVVVRVTGADRELSIPTGTDGTFVAEGLPSGTYEVAIDPGSVPAGYPVDALRPEHVVVEDTTPGRITFVLRPYRSVSGRARLFNRTSGKYEPLAQTVVELRPLGRRSVTDANGLYTFRDLPSGEYTIAALHNGQERIVALSVPDGPALLRDMDVAVVPPADVSAAPLLAGSPQAAPRPIAKNERKRSAAQDMKPMVPAAFTIHVTETSSARHARAMVEELKGGGYAAYFVEAAPAAFEVRIGPYATLADADRSVRVLEKTLGWKLRVTAAVPQPALV